MVTYKKRPDDGSRKAWDYITENFGEIQELRFSPNCCGPHMWSAILMNKKTISVSSLSLFKK